MCAYVRVLHDDGELHTRRLFYVRAVFIVAGSVRDGAAAAGARNAVIRAGVDDDVVGYGRSEKAVVSATGDGRTTRRVLEFFPTRIYLRTHTHTHMHADISCLRGVVG